MPILHKYVLRKGHNVNHKFPLLLTTAKIGIAVFALHQRNTPVRRCCFSRPLPAIYCMCTREIQIESENKERPKQFPIFPISRCGNKLAAFSPQRCTISPLKMASYSVLSYCHRTFKWGEIERERENRVSFIFSFRLSLSL